jgi:hypothetical protein
MHLAELGKTFSRVGKTFVVFVKISQVGEHLQLFVKLASKPAW